MGSLSKKTWYRCGIGILVVVVFVIAGIASALNREHTAVGHGELQVCFLQTQDDADCVLIQSQGQAILIDTGETVDGLHLLDVLHEKKIQKIDVMILTHPDKDHIGGAGLIASQMPIGKVIEPYYTLENERLTALHGELQRENVPVEIVENVTELSYSELLLTIYPPKEKEYKKDNNYSLAVLLEYGDNRMLFTGDAMKKRLKELQELDWGQVDLLKIPYHGRYVKGEEEFLQQIAPKYAVVTAADAEPEVRQSLEGMGTEVYYTRRGDLVVTVGERGYRIRQ